MREKKKIISLFLAFTLLISFSAIRIWADELSENYVTEITEGDSVLTASVRDCNFTKATVNISNLNLRSGPGTKYAVLDALPKNSALDVFGKINDWYIVYSAACGKVGCVSGNYITPVTNSAMNDPKLPDENAPHTQNGATPAPDIGSDELTILNLTNQSRAASGAGAVEYDKELARVAYYKAKDMVEKNYFSHESPTYGSPFEMIRKFGISFKAAGENIAGNKTADGAFYAWMGSEGHKANILNGNYNKIGVGVYTSPVYGKIFVQLFIKK